MTEKRETNLLNNKEKEPDFSSLNKYFLDGSLIKKPEPIKVKTIIEDVSINEQYFRKYEPEKEIETQVKTREIEKNLGSSGSEKVTLAKQKFLKSLGDESLTLDTCTNLNKN